MNETLLHRINRIEEEFDAEQGAIDLRHVATEPIAKANWAAPQRTSFDPAGFDEPSPDLPWGWIPDPKPRSWTRFWLYFVTTVALVCFAAAWPFLSH